MNQQYLNQLVIALFSLRGSGVLAALSEILVTHIDEIETATDHKDLEDSLKFLFKTFGIEVK